MNIGDTIYHKWKCVYPTGSTLNVYCMMVYNCTVSDGVNKAAVIDEFGEVLVNETKVKRICLR